MGDRGHIVVHDPHSDTPVVLYTHWGASKLPERLGDALAKRARWGDPEYLTRIIADQMSKGSGSDTTGVGIGTQLHGDVWRVIDVYVGDKEIEFRELEDAFRADEKAGERLSFKDFLQVYGPNVGVEAE